MARVNSASNSLLPSVNNRSNPVNSSAPSCNAASRCTRAIDDANVASPLFSSFSRLPHSAVSWSRSGTRFDARARATAASRCHTGPEGRAPSICRRPPRAQISGVDVSTRDRATGHPAPAQAPQHGKTVESAHRHGHSRAVRGDPIVNTQVPGEERWLSLRAVVDELDQPSPQQGRVVSKAEAPEELVVR